MDQSGFLSMALSVVSGLLTLLMSILWYQWRQALDRISKLEIYKGEAMTTIAKLKESAITRDQLAETLDQVLEKHAAPITSELRAIRADQVEARRARQETRERLIRLEAKE